jgi:prephenate dehydratase
MKKQIGYLGPEGTFSHEAGKKYLQKTKEKYVLVPYPTIHDILFAVDREEIEEGIVPVENSTEGTIGVVQDMLVKEVDLKIKDEVVLSVHNSLIAKKIIDFKNVTEVISHPQPLEQCRGWIRKNMAHARIISSSSTADAAKQVSSFQKDTICAIGSVGLAKRYNLKVIKKDITDYSDNMTRFVVVAKTDHKKTGHDKTSIVFSAIADKPGGLYKILGEFASRNINLTKIESRPSKKALGDYFFFVDMAGHRKDRLVADAISDIMNKVAFLKILGSYPKGGAKNVTK